MNYSHQQEIRYLFIHYLFKNTQFLKRTQYSMSFSITNNISIDIVSECKINELSHFYLINKYCYSDISTFFQHNIRESQIFRRQRNKVYPKSARPRSWYFQYRPNIWNCEIGERIGFRGPQAASCLFTCRNSYRGFRWLLNISRGNIIFIFFFTGSNETEFIYGYLGFEYFIWNSAIEYLTILKLSDQFVFSSQILSVCELYRNQSFDIVSFK